MSAGSEEDAVICKNSSAIQASPSEFACLVPGQLGVFAFSMGSTSKVEAQKKGLGPNLANPPQCSSLMGAGLDGSSWLQQEGLGRCCMYTERAARWISVHTTMRTTFRVTLSPETNLERKNPPFFFEVHFYFLRQVL